MTIQFVSMLSLAQAAAQTAGIERTLAQAGNLAGIDPAVMDCIDIDYSFKKYSMLLNNDPKTIRSDKEVAIIRAKRAAQQQAQQGMEQASQGADAAKVLSETQVGGGKQALEMMLGR